MRRQAFFSWRHLAVALLTIGVSGSLLAQESPEAVPDWIWAPQHRAGHVPQTECYFRKTIELSGVQQATLAVAGDDHFELFLNGHRVGEGTATAGVRTFDVTAQVRDGDNTIAIKVDNREGSTAGLAARLVVVDNRNQSTVHVTDASWKTSLSPSLLWTRSLYFDGRWRAVRKLGPFSTFSANQQETLRREAAGAAEAAATDGRTNPPRTTEQTGSRPLTRLPAASETLEVPREFELQQIAGHADIGSVTAMTFNEQGQLIVAREDGQLSLVVDQDADGQFDAVRDLGQVMKTCQGLLAWQKQLYASGLGEDGLGLYRLDDQDADGRLDGAERLVAFQGDNLEHGPHGIVLGPDGMLYVVVGNHSPLKGGIAASSPYRYQYEGDLLHPRFEDPGGHATGVRAPGGYILRTDVQGKRVEMVAGGLRNAYDLAFDPAGNLLTHDSDMESDRGTTWYRPTRVYQIIDGAEFGWRSGWSKWPDYYLDSLPGILDTGRGSPTGMVVYNHPSFPAGYQNAVFSCDWSEGRIWVMKCGEQGAGLKATAEVFVQGTPLNVTDIEVGPDGALYFATGGRDTAGNLYRVAWKGNPARSPNELEAASDLNVALRQPQLSSAWSRHRIEVIKSKLGPEWPALIEQAARDPGRPAAERIQALQLMQWFSPAPTVELLTELSHETNVPLRRRAAYYLRLHAAPAAFGRLDELLRDEDAVVRRYACEGLAQHAHPVALATVSPLLSSADRFETWAARRSLETTPHKDWKDEVLSTDDPRQFLVGATALALVAPDAATAQTVLNRSREFMQGFMSDEDFIDLLRLQQLVLLRANLKPADVPSLRNELAEEYPSSSATINRELVRLLAYLQVDWIIDRYVKELEGDWPSAEKLHLATHLTFLRSGWKTPQKMAVFQYLASPSGSGNSVPGYLQNAALQLGQQLTESERAQALANGHQNPGSALAALLRLPAKLTPQQIEQVQALDQKLSSQEGESGRRLRVAIVAILARDGSPAAGRYLREIYESDPTRRVEVALGLAEIDEDENWPYLTRSLPILEPNDARQMLVKLRSIRRWPADAEPYRQVILVAQRLGDDGADDAIALLEHWQGFAAKGNQIPWTTAVDAWKRWFQQQYPDQPVPELMVSTPSGKWDEQALLKHLVGAEREGLGSVENGRAVFSKAQCVNCHRFEDAGDTMGPDLTGVGKRFLQREILDSLLYPSRVISDQYTGKVVLTTDGKTYTGIVAQGTGAELTILQSNGEKIRVPREEVEEIEPSGVSTMPAGLLDTLTLEEITDLFAYLTADTTRLSEARPATKRN